MKHHYIPLAFAVILLIASQFPNPSIAKTGGALPPSNWSPSASTYAYVAQQRRFTPSNVDPGLWIVNVTDVHNPVPLRFVSTPDDVRRIAVNGNYVYLAASGAGLRVINVSDPQNPTPVGQYNFPGGASAEGVSISGNNVYVATSGMGLQVLSIAVPETPTLVGSYSVEGGNVYDVYTVYPYAYITHPGGLQIINISNPQSPSLSGNIRLDCSQTGFANPKRVYVFGTYAYVNCHFSANAFRVDISDSRNPRLVSPTPPPFDGLDATDSYTYMGVANELRITTLSNMQTVGSYSVGAQIVGVKIVGSYAYIAAGGVGIVNVSDLGNLQSTGFTSLPGLPTDITVQQREGVPGPTPTLEAKIRFRGIVREVNQGANIGRVKVHVDEVLVGPSIPNEVWVITYAGGVAGPTCYGSNDNASVNDRVEIYGTYAPDPFGDINICSYGDYLRVIEPSTPTFTPIVPPTLTPIVSGTRTPTSVPNQTTTPTRTPISTGPADLRIGNFRLDPATPEAFQPFSLVMTINNIGPGRYNPGDGNYKVEVSIKPLLRDYTFFFDSSNPSSNHRLSPDQLRSLDGSEGTDNNMEIEISDLRFPSALNDASIEVRLIPNGNDSNTDNNSRADHLTIRGYPLLSISQCAVVIIMGWKKGMLTAAARGMTTATREAVTDIVIDSVRDIAACSLDRDCFMNILVNTLSVVRAEDMPSVMQILMETAFGIVQDTTGCLIQVIRWGLEIVARTSAIPGQMTALATTSSVHPLVIDSENRYVGFLRDGGVVQEIPGSWVLDVGEQKFLLYSSNEPVYIAVRGTSDGAFDLMFTQTKEERTVRVEYLEVTTTRTMLGEISASDEIRTLKIDRNGDGIIDETRLPDQIVDSRPRNIVYFPLLSRNTSITQYQPTPEPGRLEVIEASLSSTNLSVGEVITARFKVRNAGGQTIVVPQLAAGVWGPNCSDFPCPDVYFPSEANVVLQPNQEHTYIQRRSFLQPGSYFAQPAFQDAQGYWNLIGSFPRMFFTVSQSTEVTPLATPTGTREATPTTTGTQPTPGPTLEFYFDKQNDPYIGMNAVATLTLFDVYIPLYCPIDLFPEEVNVSIFSQTSGYAFDVTLRPFLPCLSLYTSYTGTHDQRIRFCTDCAASDPNRHILKVSDGDLITAQYRDYLRPDLVHIARATWRADSLMVTPTTPIIVTPTATRPSSPTPTLLPTSTHSVTPNTTSTPMVILTITPTPTSTTSVQGQIIFSSDRGGNPLDVYMMNDDGTNIRRLTNSGGYNEYAKASHDGRHIVFHSTRTGTNQAHIMDIDGNNVRQLTRSCQQSTHPRWSPDDATIVFLCDYRVSYIRPDGTQFIRSDVTANPGGLDWSPNGTRIVFTLLGVNSSFDLFLVNTNGTGRTNLTNSSGTEWMPSWSPDGREILFCYTDGGTACPVYIINANGSNRRRLTEATTRTASVPSWSPDGQKIVFKSDRDGNEEIYVMNRDGSNQRRLTNYPGRDDYPSWFENIPIN